MYQPLILPHFRRQIKPFIKKYPHLKEAFVITLTNFVPLSRDALGHQLYKVRLRSKDIPRGKSKSFRLIVFVVEIERYVVPVVLYFKGDREAISLREINDHLAIILFELRAERLLGGG